MPFKRCRFCNFQFHDEDWDVLLEHIKQVHPEKLRRRQRTPDDEVAWESEDDFYEEHTG